MLILGDGYADKFPKLLERISALGSSQQALAEVYGKSLAELEQATGAYFRQTMGGDTYKSELQTGEIGPARPAEELEIGVTLTKLLTLVGNQAEATKQLGALSSKFPNRWEFEEMLAYIDWRKGDTDAAAAKFRLAFEDGAKGWKTYLDYARLLEVTHGDRELKMQAVRKALELKPDLDDARLLVGRDLYVAREYAEALAELRQIKAVDPRYEARMYLMMADAASRARQDGDARAYFDKAKALAQTPEDVAAVEAMGNSLQSGRAEPESAVPASDDDERRPILRRKPVVAPAKKGR